MTPYKAAAKRLSDMSELKKLHHDDASGQFLDWGLHTEGAELQKRSVQGPDGQQQVCTTLGNRASVALHQSADDFMLDIAMHYPYGCII